MICENLWHSERKGNRKGPDYELPAQQCSGIYAGAAAQKGELLRSLVVAARLVVAPSSLEPKLSEIPRRVCEDLLGGSRFSASRLQGIRQPPVGGKLLFAQAEAMRRTDYPHSL